MQTNHEMKPTPTQSQPVTQREYVRPQVTELGRWNAITLIYTVPIAPGTRPGAN